MPSWGDILNQMKRPTFFQTRILRLGLLASILSVALVTPLRAQPIENRGFGDRDVLQWPPSRTYHVENYKLALRFDEPNCEVFGDETIRLRPFEPHFRKFYLNSSGLTIESVTLVRARGTPVKLGYEAQDPRLWITLDRDYDATSTLQVRIVVGQVGQQQIRPILPLPRGRQAPFSQNTFQ